MDLRAFASGEQMGLGDDEATAAYYRLLNGELGVPVIGAANGSALAGGLEVLLGCDVIVASSEAKFGLPEVKRGLFPGATARPSPPGAVERRAGDDTHWRQHRCDACVRVGARQRRCRSGGCAATAIGFAERIAANGPLGVAAAKELTRLAVVDDARASERLRELQALVFGSEDAREGAMAFVEKREPVWRGR